MSLLRISKRSDQVHVRFPAHIDLKILSPLREMACSVSATTIKRWILDLADCQTLNEAGINALLYFADLTVQHDAEICFVNVSPVFGPQLSAKGLRVISAKTG